MSHYNLFCICVVVEENESCDEPEDGHQHEQTDSRPSSSGSNRPTSSCSTTNSSEPADLTSPQAKKRRFQPKIINFVDSLSPTESHRIDVCLANAAYYTGLPNDVYERNPNFAESFKLLRPAYTNPPSRHALGNHLLNAAFSEAEKETSSGHI